MVEEKRPPIVETWRIGDRIIEIEAFGPTPIHVRPATPEDAGIPEVPESGEIGEDR